MKSLWHFNRPLGDLLGWKLGDILTWWIGGKGTSYVCGFKGTKYYVAIKCKGGFFWRIISKIGNIHHILSRRTLNTELVYIVSSQIHICIYWWKNEMKEILQSLKSGCLWKNRWFEFLLDTFMDFIHCNENLLLLSKICIHNRFNIL